MSKTMNWVLGAAMACGFATGAVADNNGGGAYAPADAPGALAATRGVVMCTAAMNSNGSIAGGFHVNNDVSKTYRDGVGEYVVSFVGCNKDVRAASGASRWVQVDTLTTGIPSAVTCGTADRFLDKTAVWVQCRDTSGNAADTSFFLFVAR